MKRIGILIFLIASALTSMAESVGLVLSGGGAKGIAHIGVIKALEDNDIPIDYITGTSMGAIIGGLYAAGYTPLEMLELIKSDGFAEWSTGNINNDLTYYFDRKEPTPAMFHLNFGSSDSSAIKANILPASLINPLPMNFAFMELFSPYTAQCAGNFDNLYVPFRCVASDVFNKRKLVMKNGSLGVAIRASMSFPIIYKPQYIDSIPIFDGGIYENFPVNVMKEEFSPDFIIGVDVNAGKPETGMDNIIKQVQSMIVQNSDSDIAPADGIKIGIELKEFNILDFQKADSIYHKGYAKAMSMIDSIKSRTSRRVSKTARNLSRTIFKSKTPNVAFESVNVVGGSKRQNDYLLGLFSPNNDNDTLSLINAQTAYYRAISSEKINDLIPEATYNPDSKMFNLKLRVQTKDPMSVGLGGWLSSSTNSMIFLSGNYNTLSYNSFDANLQGWVGQSYYAGAIKAKVALQTHTPSYIEFEGVMSKQKFYENDALFYENELPTFITNYEKFLRLKYMFAIGRKSRMGLSIGYGHLKDRFYQSNTIDFSNTKQDEAHYKLGQVMLSFDNNTLNHIQYPTTGNRFKINIIGVYGTSQYIQNEIIEQEPATSTEDKNGWIQGEMFWDKYINPTRHFSLGLKINAVASTRPLGANYTAMLVQATAFTPTPSTQNYFNAAFRSNSYAAAGILPIWTISNNLQFRTEFYAFAPFREITENKAHIPEYGKWFRKIDYMGEVSLSYSLPFASLSIYCNYLSYPKHNWNFGINFGVLLYAPKFLK